MKLYQIKSKEFGLAHGKQLCAWVGSECEGCKQYLVPIRVPEDEEVREDEWMIRPSKTNRPILQANADKAEGLILKLSSFDKPGKVFGRIFIYEGEPRLVTNGVGRTENTFFEEAIFIVTTKTMFLLWLTSGDEQLIIIDPMSGAYMRSILNPRETDGRGETPLNSPDLKRWNDAS